MAIQTLQIIKSWFRKGLYPTEGQFSDTWDSFWHKTDELIPMSRIEELTNTLNGKADAEVIILINEAIEALKEEVHSNTTYMHIHARRNSVLFPEPFKITGIAINNHCERILIADKGDMNNTLEIECYAQEDGLEIAEANISLERFFGKACYIFASTGEQQGDVDVSFTLKLITN
ncbi:MAG: hypothetical protein LBN27_07870 [Prevotellaceae bacterium]|jgi:hypothetical protein|nr:hypothetical protein [Prevotellaceae bacterium]